MSVMFGRRCSLFILVFLSYIATVDSHVRRAYLFDDFMTNRQLRLDGTSSNVLLVDGVAQFYRDVICSEKPVVVRVVSRPSVSSIFHEVADTFRGRVKFVDVNANSISQIIGAIMGRLRLRQIKLPFFLFFRSGVLIPPLLTGGEREELIKVIKKLFFSGRASSQDTFLGLRKVFSDVRSYQRNRL